MTDRYTKLGSNNEFVMKDGDPIQVAADLGAAAGTGVTAKEYGDGVVHKTVLTLSDVSIATDDNTTAGAQGSQKIYDFPAGNIIILGATTDLTVAAGSGGLSDTAELVGSVGTVAAASDNGTLSSTEANIVPSTAATLTAGEGTMKGESTAGTTVNGTSSAVDAILNFAVPDAGTSADDTLTVNGTVTIVWINAGDN